jgi:hypothetical protein
MGGERSPTTRRQRSCKTCCACQILAPICTRGWKRADISSEGLCRQRIRQFVTFRARTRKRRLRHAGPGWASGCWWRSQTPFGATRDEEIGRAGARSATPDVLVAKRTPREACFRVGLLSRFVLPNLLPNRCRLGALFPDLGDRTRP